MKTKITLILLSIAIVVTLSLWLFKSRSLETQTMTVQALLSNLQTHSSSLAAALPPGYAFQPGSSWALDYRTHAVVFTTPQLIKTKGELSNSDFELIRPILVKALMTSLGSSLHSIMPDLTLQIRFPGEELLSK